MKGGGILAQLSSCTETCLQDPMSVTNHYPLRFFPTPLQICQPTTKHLNHGPTPSTSINHRITPHVRPPAQSTPLLIQPMAQPVAEPIPNGQDPELAPDPLPPALKACIPAPPVNLTLPFQTTGCNPSVMKTDFVFEAGASAMKLMKGAYSCLALVQGVGLVAFRDPHGIR